MAAPLGSAMHGGSGHNGCAKTKEHTGYVSIDNTVRYVRYLNIWIYRYMKQGLRRVGFCFHFLPCSYVAALHEHAPDTTCPCRTCMVEMETHAKISNRKCIFKMAALVQRSPASVHGRRSCDRVEPLPIYSSLAPLQDASEAPS